MKYAHQMYRRCIVVLSFVGIVAFYNPLLSQLSATFTKTINTKCNGSGCDYSGPSILINEIMMSPDAVYDGSLYENGNARQGEWIELYNPNICQPIDISCYYLGNNATDGLAFNKGAGLVIPIGTVIPPAGFCVIRGINSTPVDAARLVQNGGNTVEIVTNSSIVCMEGTRLWFPNAGSWFAFYDNNGVPQDAVTWGNQSNLGNVPCRANFSGCGYTGSLASYNQISTSRKNVIAGSGNPPYGKTIRRIPDGGSWDYDNYQNPTQGYCNATCATPASSSCDGTATINVTGGTPPYTYVWNDSEAQLTQTANGLCAGTYMCQVTDANNVQQSFSVTIEDFVPVVTVSIQENICQDAGSVNLTNVSPVAAAGQTSVLTGTGLTGQTFNPATAGVGEHIITHQFTDENGCANTAKDTIRVRPVPVVSIAMNPTYCMSSDPVTPTLTPPGGVLSGPGTANNKFISANAGVGQHTLTYVYENEFGCENSATVNVEVFSVPPPVFNIQELVCYDAAPVQLQGTPAGGVYSIGGNTITEFNPVLYTPGAYTIKYIVTDAAGCIGETTDNITVIGAPQLSSDLTDYCFGTTVVPLNYSPAGGTLTGNNTQGIGLDLTNVNPGTYSVTYTYTDQNGCSNTLTEEYILAQKFHPSFTYSGDCFQNAAFVPTTKPANVNYTYFWDFDVYGTSVNTSPTVYFAQHGQHDVYLKVTDQYGCSYDTTQQIFIVEGIGPNTFVVPNVITPNGDGVNDFISFLPQVDECVTYKILILNRWGNVVYEMKDASTAFRGKDKQGADLADGVYFYILQSDDIDCNSPEFKGMCSGMITIIRK